MGIVTSTQKKSGAQKKLHLPLDALWPDGRFWVVRGLGTGRKLRYIPILRRTLGVNMEDDSVPNNLFITYQLTEPEAHQAKVLKAIQALGNSTQLHASCWYVNSSHTASSAAERIGGAMHPKDILVIADTTNNSSIWHNLSEAQAIRVKQNWKI